MNSKILSEFTTPFLVVILIVVSFVLGSLWTKVQFLEKGANVAGTKVTDTNAQAPSQPNNPQPQAAAAPTTISDDQFKNAVKDGILITGKDSAKVKIVEFSDFQCPFCGKFFTDTFGQIEKDYANSGKVAVYYRHFPLTSIHENAQNAALAAECAREQNKFRAYHDVLFKNQTALQADNLKKYAGQAGLNTSQFNSCFDNQKYKNNVDRDVQVGTQLGVTVTPTFFVNGKVVNGAQPYAPFKSMIDTELAK